MTVAAATDAALRGIAVAVHALPSFNVLQTLSAGIMAAFNAIPELGKTMQSASQLRGLSFEQALAVLLKAAALSGMETLALQLTEMEYGLRSTVNFNQVVANVMAVLLNSSLNTAIGKAPLLASSQVSSSMEQGVVEQNLNGLTNAATMGTESDPLTVFSQGSDTLGRQITGLLSTSTDPHGQKTSTLAQQTGLNRPAGDLPGSLVETTTHSSGNNSEYRMGVSDVSLSNFALKQLAQGNAYSNPLTSGTGSQWTQSAMDYNKSNSPFGYSEAASNIPSSSLNAAQYTDFVARQSTLTMKYHEWSQSSPSSVQPSAQGAAGRKYSLWEDIKYTAEGAYDDYEGIQASPELRTWQGSNRVEFPKTARRVDRMVSSFNRAQNDLDAFMAPVTHYLAPMLQLTSDGLGALQDYVIDPLSPWLLSNPGGIELDAVLMGLKGAVGYAALSLRGSSLLEGGAASGVSLDASAGSERLVPASKGGIFGSYERVASRAGSTSSVNALKQKTVLALQEAGVLNLDESLTESAIESARSAMRSDSVLQNPSVVKALTSDGSSLSDWSKMTTQSVRLPNGQRAQVHFYFNPETGEINYTHSDFKVKGEVSVFPGADSPSELIKEYISTPSMK